MHCCLSLHVYPQHYRSLLQEEIIQLHSSGRVTSVSLQPPGFYLHGTYIVLRLVRRQQLKDRTT
jgi:hypothetical protein